MDKGRASERSFVEVSPTAVTINHPLLKQPVSFSPSAIAVAVRQSTIERSDLVLAREPRPIKLSAKALDGNVVFLLSRPVDLGRFKFGAENTLPITKRVRRQGATVEMIVVTVRDPDGLIDAVFQTGSATSASLPTALVSVFGEATPAEAAIRRAEAAKKARRARIKLGAWITALLLAYSGRLSVRSDGDFDVRSFVVQAVAAAVLVGIGIGIAFVVPVRPLDRSRPVSDGRTASRRVQWFGLGMLAGLFALFGVGYLAVTEFDVSRRIAFVPVIAAPAILLVVPTIIGARRARLAPVPPLGEPADQPQLPGTGVPPSPHRR